MTTSEMFKFWFIKQVGIPVCIILGIVATLVIGAFVYAYVVYPVQRWIKAKKGASRE